MSNKKIGITLLILDVLCIILNASNAVIYAMSSAPLWKVILHSACAAVWVVCTILHYLTYFKRG